MHSSGPPGFVGLDPYKPVRVYHRHLPHWRQDGATYAVTFRQADALPQSRIDEIKALRHTWEVAHPNSRSEADWKTFARQYTRRVNSWLDDGYGSCLFKDRQPIEILKEAMTRFHNRRYHTGALVVMPNHTHLILRPLEGETLESILKAIKGTTARKVNQLHGTGGRTVWAQESYDRILRDEQHLREAIKYIGLNPTKAGLAHERSHRCWMARDWAQAGWGFPD